VEIVDDWGRGRLGWDDGSGWQDDVGGSGRRVLSDVDDVVDRVDFDDLVTLEQRRAQGTAGKDDGKQGGVEHVDWTLIGSWFR